MSDQERDKLSKLPNETGDDADDDVEAHKHGGRDMDESEDSDDDVEAHKHGGKDT